MEMTEEDMFVMKMDKVITMTECRDQKLIKIYKQYVEEKILMKVKSWHLEVKKVK